jgi:hypothetical protein
MKQLVAIAKTSMNDKDGFLNGMFKGIVGSAAIISIVSLLAGYGG